MPGFNYKLEQGQIDVWHIPLDLSEGGIAINWNNLDAIEKNKAMKFVFPINQQQYIAAHGQMRCILSNYLGVAAKSIRISNEKGKKPYLLDFPLHFNLSHSDNYALLGVSSTGQIGVDVECEAKEKVVNISALSKSVFSTLESSAIVAMSEPKRTTAFFKCWTQKEAFIKAIGLGFSYDTKSFSVATEPDKPARFLFFNNQDYEAKHWHLFSFQPFQNTQAALAFAFTPTQINHVQVDLNDKMPRPKMGGYHFE